MPHSRAPLCLTVLALCLACTESGSDRDSGMVSSGVSPDSSDWEPDPFWTVDEVASQLEAFMAMGVPSGREITRVYDELMSHGDGLCPSPGDVFEALNSGCISAEGYQYTGIGWLHYGVKRADDGVPLEWNHGGDFEIIRPDGSVFAGGGEMVMAPAMRFDGEPGAGALELDDRELLDQAGVIEQWTLDVHGSWVDDARDDWLGKGFSGVILAEVREDTRAGEAMARLHGGMAVGDIDLFFDETVWFGDSRCEQGVVGTIRLRDPRGYWVAWELESDCDSCGELVFHEDQSMGELCLDMSTWSRQVYAAWAPN